MNFNDHPKLRGQHAFLGASKYHWLNYDPNKIAEAYRNFLAVAMGTRLHEYAAESIDLGQRLPKSHKTLNMYVNDAIGFKLRPEQVLYYSPNCFGTADAIEQAIDEIISADFMNVYCKLRFDGEKTDFVDVKRENVVNQTA